MGTHLLSGLGKRVLGLMLVCCLWSFVAPSDARAAAAFSNPTCTVQSIAMGGTTVWQIKGSTSVTGLPTPIGGVQVQVTFQFARKAQGAKTWSNMFMVTQSTTSNTGTANLDTGFIAIMPPPAQGEQFEVIVSGMYSPPPTVIPSMTSPPVTPVP